MSSALAQLSSRMYDLKFGDLLQALRDRGLDARADLYEAAILVECFLHEIDSPLELTIRDIVELHMTPDPGFSAGWDHAYRGRAKGRAYYGRDMR